MSDEQQSQIERAISRAFEPRRRMSRRGFILRAGKGGLYAAGALSLPSILAACGITGNSTAPSASAAASLPASPAGTLDFANWPAYIDIDDNGDYPTIKAFEDQTGIAVKYTEDINDNAEFFGKIQPDLAAGNPTGYDLIVLTDWMIDDMIRLGYLETLDQSKLTNWSANAQDLYRDPWYDPGNAHSIAWQSGITGIGYNPTLTGRAITSFDDLFDPAFAGRVGMFSEMRDTMSLTLLSMGIKPADATIDDATAAQQKLLDAVGKHQFRAFYGNDYYDALAANDLALCIAWSGDISQMKLYDNSDVEFVVPDSGGMLWVDNMAIPNKAAHPVDAHMMMDYWYTLDAAVPLTEYIGYFSPVKGVAEQVKADAKDARDSGDTETADALDVVAATAFPDNATLQNVYTYKQLSEDEERQWNDLFNAVLSG